MIFEWDEAKDKINAQKHGVSFDEAKKAFADPGRKVAWNQKHSIEEKRYYCFGKVGERVMTVRFTLRGEKIRIIGAGYWRQGRKSYEKE